MFMNYDLFVMVKLILRVEQQGEAYEIYSQFRMFYEYLHI